MTEILTKDDLDIFRGEHPDTRPASEWWKIVQNKLKKPFTPQLQFFSVVKTCRICDKQFTSNVQNKVTCSKSCSQINKINNTIKNNKLKLKPKKDKVCVICFSHFLCSMPNTKTCSPECRNKLRNFNTTQSKAKRKSK